MIHLPFTLFAYVFNAASVTIDKFLLIKSIQNPLTYIFYLSVFSLAILILLPFTKIPASEAFILGSISTLLWTTGAYFMYSALKVGQVTRVIPVIGTLIPIILLIEATFNKTIASIEILAVIILILGLLFLTLVDWKGKLIKKEIVLEIFSAVFFAISYLVLKQAYLRAEFLTVLVWSRMILIPIGLIILLLPKLRSIVFSQAEKQQFKFFSKSGLLFLSGQACGGASELLITFSISLATPALVNSLQGVQYAFLFIFSIILSRKFPNIFMEKFSAFYLFSKIVGIFLLGTGLYLLAFRT